MGNDPFSQRGPEAPPPNYPQDPRNGGDVAAARQRSFTNAAVITLVLYVVLWLPGLIANILYYSEAKRVERIAGQSLPGVGCLAAMLWIVGLGIGLLVLLVVLIIAAA